MESCVWPASILSFSQKAAGGNFIWAAAVSTGRPAWPLHFPSSVVYFQMFCLLLHTGIVRQKCRTCQKFILPVGWTTNDTQWSCNLKFRLTLKWVMWIKNQLKYDLKLTVLHTTCLDYRVGPNSLQIYSHTQELTFTFTFTLAGCLGCDRDSAEWKVSPSIHDNASALD